MSDVSVEIDALSLAYDKTHPIGDTFQPELRQDMSTEVGLRGSRGCRECSSTDTEIWSRDRTRLALTMAI